MPTSKDALVMCARASALPKLSRAMERVKQTGTCEFGCGELVVYNRGNVANLRFQGKNPVLICMDCYYQGAHIRQGYRSV